MEPEERVQLTDPDYTVYAPSSTDQDAEDRCNEHFLAFDGPDGSLMVVWTQSRTDPKAGRANRNGNDVLWYPESKFFLLGKRITPEFLADMEVPGEPVIAS